MGKRLDSSSSVSDRDIDDVPSVKQKRAKGSDKKKKKKKKNKKKKRSKERSARSETRSACVHKIEEIEMSSTKPKKKRTGAGVDGHGNNSDRGDRTIEHGGPRGF